MGGPRPITTGKTLWLVALPIMFVELSETILHVIDTALLGRVGTTELAALVLADTVLEIWVVALIALTDALQIVVARRVGEGAMSSVGATFNRTLPLVVMVSIALMVALKVISPAISGVIAESNAIGDAVDRFLQVAAFGLPFLGISFAYSAFYIGITRTRALVVATVVLAAVNAGLGYALVLGRLGAPRLGLEGAALASVMAELAAAIALVAYAFRRRYTEQYALLRSGRAMGLPMTSLIGIAGPIAVYGLIEGAQWLAFFVILEQMGTEILAWSNVIYAWLLVLLIPSEAMSELTVSAVSSTVGRGEPHRTRDVAGRLIRHGLLASLPLGILAVLAPAWVFSIFGGVSQPDTAALRALQLVAAGVIVGIPAFVWGSAVHGTGDTRAGSAFDSLAAVVMLGWAFVAALVLRQRVGVIWAALPVSWAVSLVLSYGWMRSGRWKRVTI